MRLTTIRNRLERTISASGGIELLQMISEPVTGQCTNEFVDPQEGRLRDSRSVGERIETLLISVWKPLSSKRVLNPQNITYKGVETSQ